MTSDATSTDPATSDANAAGGQSLDDLPSIQSLLPHRYPFLLVDRIVSFERGKRIHAYKNVTINEPFFQGHFPSHPVMPGVLVIEAMAHGTAPDAQSTVRWIMVVGLSTGSGGVRVPDHGAGTASIASHTWYACPS